MMNRLYPYISMSRHAKDNTIAGRPLARRIFYSTKNHPDLVPDPWTGELYVCVIAADVHYAALKNDGRIHTGSRDPQTPSLEIACQFHKSVRDRDSLPPRYTRSIEATTCAACLLATKQQIWVPETDPIDPQGEHSPVDFAAWGRDSEPLPSIGELQDDADK